MQKTINFLVLLMVASVMMLIFMGCAGVSYVKETKLSNGSLLVQGGRTGPFGTDNSFMEVVPSAAEPAKTVKLTKTYEKKVLSWDGCSDEKPNPRAKNIKRLKQNETWTEEVLVGGQQAPTQFWAGGNASTGNLFAPAIAIGAGMAGGAALLRPNNSNITSTGNGAAAAASTSASTSATPDIFIVK